MDRFEILDTLEFQNDFIANKEIQTITAIQMNALVMDWQRMLNFELDLVQLQLVGQALLICRFEQSWPQITMDFNSTTNDSV